MFIHALTISKVPISSNNCHHAIMAKVIATGDPHAECVNTSLEHMGLNWVNTGCTSE